MSPRYDPPALLVECPKCGAAYGRECRSKANNSTSTHLARSEKYAAQGPDEPPTLGCRVTLAADHVQGAPLPRCNKPIVYARMQLCAEHLADRERLLRSAR